MTIYLKGICSNAYDLKSKDGLEVEGIDLVYVKVCGEDVSA